MIAKLLEIKLTENDLEILEEALDQYISINGFSWKLDIETGIELNELYRRLGDAIVKIQNIHSLNTERTKEICKLLSEVITECKR